MWVLLELLDVESMQLQEDHIRPSLILNQDMECKCSCVVHHSGYSRVLDWMKMAPHATQKANAKALSPILSKCTYLTLGSLGIWNKAQMQGLRGRRSE